MRLMPSLFFATAWTCLALPASIAQQTDIDALREEIRTAWAKRRAAVRTLGVEATIDHFIPGTEDHEVAPLDPFDNPTSSQDLGTEWQLSYRYTEEKRWKRLHSDKHPVSGKPSVLKPYTCTSSFDGKENRSLLECAPSLMPIGRVELSNKPGGPMVVGTHLIALLLWKDAEGLFDRLAWRPERMFPEDPAVAEKGQEYARFILPRRGTHWTSTLDLDAKHGWLPMQWEGRYRGVLMFSYELEYDLPDPAMPKLTGWKGKQYSERGELESRDTAKVSVLEVNQPIPDGELEVAFPVGARVMKTDKQGQNSFFFQGVDGLISITEEQFSLPPKH